MDVLTLIKQAIQEEFSTFQDQFEQALKSDNALLHDVLQHLRKSKGKQMRPMLTIIIAKLLGTVTKETIYSAISLEMLHTATLVHDDVVDESNQRRGVPSVNASFNNKVAVLSGDYLLSTSLFYISKTSLPAVAIVSRLGQQLASGELLQLFNTTSTDFSEESYYQVIKEKTASLFEACCQLGALSVQASEEALERCRQFGECLGMIFQIRDDIFDYYSDDVGKPTGNDMKEGKLTLPALFAINQHFTEEIKEKALRIRCLQATDSEIATFITWVIEQGGIAYAKQKMLELHEQALALLQPFADTDVKAALVAFLDYVSDRKK